jgi:hypothetical protein
VQNLLRVLLMRLRQDFALLLRLSLELLHYLELKLRLPMMALEFLHNSYY